MRVAAGDLSTSRSAIQTARKACESHHGEELDALEATVSAQLAMQEEQAKTLAARPALLAAGYTEEQLTREGMLPICKERNRMPIRRHASKLLDGEKAAEALPYVWDCDEKVLYQEQPQTLAACKSRELDFTMIRDENGNDVGACTMSAQLIEEERLRKTCKVGPAAKIVTAEDGWVMATCLAAITKVLKSPATAEFPGMFDGDRKPSSADGCTKVYTSYVDAQNAFGAKIRTNYVCTYDPRTGGVTTKLR